MGVLWDALVWAHRCWARSLSRLERYSDKVEVDGSNPSGPTNSFWRVISCCVERSVSVNDEEMIGQCVEILSAFNVGSGPESV